MTAVHSTTVIFFYVQLIACVTSQGCPSGYFGTSCKYKCRCKLDTCDANGSCLGGDTCLPGWFGPACQYADIAYGQPVRYYYLTDGDDRTCRDYSGGTRSVTLNLPESYPFTWLRVHVNSSEVVSNLQVTFNNTVSCNNPRSAPVDGQTWDIYCSMDEFVKSVTLTGPAAASLCSIYISGGRNIAINENAQQTSTWSSSGIDYTASLSVDGKVNPDFYGGKTCSATLGKSTPDFWSVIFSRARVVNRYAIYNTVNDTPHRLKGFSLESFDGSTRVFHYTNGQDILPVYTVKHGHLQMTFVRITSGSADRVLQMCEMEIYGESICIDGQYGRDCEQTCNCAGGQPCFVSTGGCPSGCASGYHGADCKIPCSPGKYRLGCLTNCSEFCTRDATTGVRSCDRFNGTCNLGCEDGYRGSNCTLPCSPGKYGLGCLTTCSEFCTRDETTGVRSCDRFNGTCNLGCEDGYRGSNCTLHYGSNEETNNRQLIGIIVGCLLGVIIVAVIIAAGIIVFRRRQTAKCETHGVESRNSMSLSHNDPSKVNRTLAENACEIPGISKSMTQVATQMGSQGKIEPEETFGDDYVVQSCDDSEAHTFADSVARTYEEIACNLAISHENVVDDSNKDITPTHSCPVYANTD